MKEALVNIIRYESFILIGIFMSVGTAVKLSGVVHFSSDWFWFLAGLGLTVEGLISLSKQKKFDRKYKILLRDTHQR